MLSTGNVNGLLGGEVRPNVTMWNTHRASSMVLENCTYFAFFIGFF